MRSAVRHSVRRLPRRPGDRRRATILLMVVGLLAMMFIVLSSYITVARFDSLTQQSIERGAVNQEAAANIDDQVKAAVTATWVDPDVGQTLQGGENFSFEDIPGQYQTQWLAPAQPIVLPATEVDPALTRLGANVMPGYADNWSAISDELYPLATTLVTDTSAFGEATGGAMSLLHMLRNFDTDGDFSDELDFVDGNNPGDVVLNARRPFMDANGDGMPDSTLTATASLTQTANLAAGSTAALPGIDQVNWQWAVDYADRLAWERYDETASHEVAARVISHGGMIALPDLATDRPNWWLADSLFRWLTDGAIPSLSNDIYAQFEGDSAVEARLRWRGSMLAPAPSDAAPSAFAEALDNSNELSDALWPRPLRNRDDPLAFERFDLSEPSALLEWRTAAALDATAYNLNDSSYDDLNARERIAAHNKRQYFTTVNRSDDLVRKLDADRTDTTLRGVFRGETKFYLGDLHSAYAREAWGYSYDEGAGEPLLEQLIDRYTDMLAAYDLSDGPVGNTSQAIMLAVNTLAAAAPYADPATSVWPGRIEAPFYTDNATNRTYYGYVPQPFITQVTVARTREVDPVDPLILDDEYDLVFEIYNPYDRPLNLRQYAFSVQSTAVAPDQLLITPFDSPQAGRTRDTLDARSYGLVRVRIDGLTPDAFLSLNPVALLANYAAGAYTGADNLTVRLWRTNPNPTATYSWYVVDKLDIETVDPLERPPDPDTTEREFFDAWTTQYRDTAASNFFGRRNGRLAAWQMVVPFEGGVGTGNYESDDSADFGAGGGGPSSPWLTGLGAAGPVVTVDSDADARPIPLYTSNPSTESGILFEDPTTWPVIHGWRRPPAFPTVGFLHLVPRFAHYDEDTGTTFETMGEVLAEALQAYGDPAVAKGSDAPIDFGHMPLFDHDADSTGKLENNSYFSTSASGRGLLPWGLLVYDYFTTVNPNGPDAVAGTADDVDPYAISGRININTASWFMLAGLPLIDGVSGTTPLFEALGLSPALWDPDSKVMVGDDPRAVGARNCIDRLVLLAPQFNNDNPFTYATNAHPKLYPHAETTAGGESFFRLGALLGQAIAAHRDRVPYVDPTPSLQLTPYPDAHTRNESYAYRSAAFGPLRGQAGGNNARNARGFLSVGELLNVQGFDGTIFDPATGDPAAGAGNSVVNSGDFMQSISLMLLLDSHYLTTRSNTFTAYLGVFNRDAEEAYRSTYTQTTFDRTNLLPRFLGLDTTTAPPAPVYEERSSVQPTTISTRRAGYFDTK